MIHSAMPTRGTEHTNDGVVTSVRGSVVDVRFEESLPPIYSLLRTVDRLWLFFGHSSCGSNPPSANLIQDIQQFGPGAERHFAIGRVRSKAGRQVE
jgi:hypothetical protein